MIYNKLVRDKIPEYIKSQGGTPKIHIAADLEFGEKLKEKLKEEVNEFCASEVIEEMADILEVIEAICRYKKFSQQDLKRMKKKKAVERGTFKRRIILERS